MGERNLNDRLNDLYDRMISVEALTKYGTANEMKFYIFDYDPKDEETIRKSITKMKNNNHNIVEFDLYEIMLQIMRYLFHRLLLFL